MTKKSNAFTDISSGLVRGLANQKGENADRLITPAVTERLFMSKEMEEWHSGAKKKVEEISLSSATSPGGALRPGEPEHPAGKGPWPALLSLLQNLGKSLRHHSTWHRAVPVLLPVSFNVFMSSPVYTYLRPRGERQLYRCALRRGACKTCMEQNEEKVREQFQVGHFRCAGNL